MRRPVQRERVRAITEAVDEAVRIYGKPLADVTPEEAETLLSLTLTILAARGSS